MCSYWNHICGYGKVLQMQYKHNVGNEVNSGKGKYRTERYVVMNDYKFIKLLMIWSFEP